MDLKELLLTKNSHKDSILGTSTALNEVAEVKNKVFEIKNSKIILNNSIIDIEALYLNKVELTEDILVDIEKETRELYNKINYLVKMKIEQSEKLTYEIKQISDSIDYIMSLRNKSVNDIVGVINNNLTNIISKDILFFDNLNTSNGRYVFLTGERYILSNDEIEIIEHSSNYKIELKIKNRNFINYILFNDSLKTYDTFKISFMSSNTTVKEVLEVNVNENPFVEASISADRIIVEGVGAREIVSSSKICVGRNIYNYNRALAIYECDFEKSKLPSEFLFKAHEDVKAFLIPKKGFEINELWTYQEFKERYFLLENIIKKDVSKYINLQDNYVVCFIETSHEMLEELKIYGVD